jgi:hypothetical protein
MSQHFEDLWELAEKSFTNKQDEDIELITNQLMLKASLYKKMCSQPNTPKEELEKIKSHLMGEILLTLTQLSFKENIDVFAALKTALYFSTIEKYQSSSSP